MSLVLQRVKQINFMNRILSDIIGICLLFNLISCKESIIEKDQTITGKMEIVKIKQVYEDQTRVESEENEFSDPYKLTVKDLSLVFKIEQEGLSKAGFKNIDKDTFEKKIHDIFGIKVDSNNCNKVKINDSIITYYGNSLDGTAETLAHNEFELQSITNNLFFSREFNIITPMYLLRDLIKFNGNDYKLILPQNIIARNKYLLNDDKSLLPWLTSNDSVFMKNLLIKFGYIKDAELLKWIVKNNSFEQKSKSINNGIEFGHIIYNRNCNNKFKINTEIFEVMALDMTPTNSLYLDNLLEYVLYLVDQNNDPELSFEERSSLIAHILYFCQDMASNKGFDAYTYKCMGFFSENYDINGLFDKEFKKRNFYNLSNFEKMWNESKMDGDGISLPGEE